MQAAFFAIVRRQPIKKGPAVAEPLWFVCFCFACRNYSETNGADGSRTRVRPK